MNLYHQSLNSPFDAKFPVDSLSSQNLAFPPLLQHHTQDTDLVLPQDATLPLVDSPGGLSSYDPTTRGIGNSTLATSEFSWREPGVKSWSSSNLTQYKAMQDFLSLHSSEASSGGDPAIYLIDPGNLSFVSLDVLSFLERQIKERDDLLIWKEKERKIEPFPKQFKLEYPLNSSGKMLVSVADQQDSAVSLPFGSSTRTPVELHMPQQHSYVKNSEHELTKKYTQLFWGLPSMHSESLSITVPAFGDCFFYLLQQTVQCFYSL
jgi:hypothetical protein